ncbi:hypothetical protein KXV86_001981 [Aspergillus fumigatus]|nr:hypothetical protein KXV48_002536 [Aspergillus fumigatus]KAH2585305.1 hypothetical protein KXV99_004638 [Aspergillus fumigatus]KAH3215235.1 hypothetical protein KXV86_001981 [Aspergillus fumigatus]KAH3328930.1 hypothetical protein KXW13_009446 [Aspergillus fumigatus]
MESPSLQSRLRPHPLPPPLADAAPPAPACASKSQAAEVRPMCKYPQGVVLANLEPATPVGVAILASAPRQGPPGKPAPAPAASVPPVGTMVFILLLLSAPSTSSAGAAPPPANLPTRHRRGRGKKPKDQKADKGEGDK